MSTIVKSVDPNKESDETKMVESAFKFIKDSLEIMDKNKSSSFSVNVELENKDTVSILCSGKGQPECWLDLSIVIKKGR